MNNHIDLISSINVPISIFTFALVFKTAAFTAVILEIFSFRNSFEFKRRSFE